MLGKTYQVAVVVAEYAFEDFDWFDRSDVYQSPECDPADAKLFSRFVHRQQEGLVWIRRSRIYFFWQGSVQSVLDDLSYLAIDLMVVADGEFDYCLCRFFHGVLLAIRLAGMSDRE